MMALYGDGARVTTTWNPTSYTISEVTAADADEVNELEPNSFQRSHFGLPPPPVNAAAAPQTRRTSRTTKFCQHYGSDDADSCGACAHTFDHSDDDGNWHRKNIVPVSDASKLGQLSKLLPTTSMLPPPSSSTAVPVEPAMAKQQFQQHQLSNSMASLTLARTSQQISIGMDVELLAKGIIVGFDNDDLVIKTDTGNFTAKKRSEVKSALGGEMETFPAHEKVPKVAPDSRMEACPARCKADKT